MHKGTMRCQSMPRLQVRCPHSTSVGVVRWVSGRASSGWGPGLGAVGEVGETDIHTAEIAAYLHSLPSFQTTHRWCGRGWRVEHSA